MYQHRFVSPIFLHGRADKGVVPYGETLRNLSDFWRARKAKLFSTCQHTLYKINEANLVLACVSKILKAPVFF